MELSNLELRLLKHLEELKGISDKPENVMSELSILKYEYDAAALSLKNKGFVNKTKSSINILPAGRVYLDEYLPVAQPAIKTKKITIITILTSLWDVISKNPLISGVIASIIAAIILKRFGVI